MEHVIPLSQVYSSYIVMSTNHIDHTAELALQLTKHSMASAVFQNEFILAAKPKFWNGKMPGVAQAHNTRKSGCCGQCSLGRLRCTALMLVKLERN